MLDLDRNSDAKQFDLGVLVVHGIGQQNRGSTLVQIVEPIIRWLAGRGHLPSRGALTDVDVSGLDSGIGEPAQAVVTVKGESEDVTQQWLLAESNWSDSFHPPTYIEFLKWILGVWPGLAVLHFAGVTNRVWTALHRDTWLRKICSAVLISVVAVLMAIGALLMTLAVPLILLLITPFALLPIGVAEKIFLATQETLSKVVGDSYVFLARPLQRASIINTVRRDLEWLERRTERQAIVAHSQGAAVVYECLSEFPRKSDNGLFLATIGSGIKKLLLLKEKGDEIRLLGWLPLAVGSFFLALLAANLFLQGGVLSTMGDWIVARGGEPDTDTSLTTTADWYGKLNAVMLVMGILFYFITLLSAFLVAKNMDVAALIRDSGIRNSVNQWLDYFASEDPVSNGWLVGRDAAFPKSVPLHNLNALTRDHTAYWRNDDQFFSHLTLSLMNFSSALPFRSVDSETYPAAWTDRRLRVGFLTVFRWTLVLQLIIALGVQIDDFREHGRFICHSLASSIPSFFWASESEKVSPCTDYLSLYGLGATILVFLVAYAIGRFAWAAWNGSAMRRHSHNFQDTSCHSIGVIGAISLATAGIWTALWMLDTYSAPYSLLGTALWVGFAIFVVSTPLLWAIRRNFEEGIWDALIGTVLAAALLWPVVLSEFSIDQEGNLSWTIPDPAAIVMLTAAFIFVLAYRPAFAWIDRRLVAAASKGCPALD